MTQSLACQGRRRQTADQMSSGTHPLGCSESRKK
jgi:hypothetical protein